jgi:hypothetical protein
LSDAEAHTLTSRCFALICARFAEAPPDQPIRRRSFLDAAADCQIDTAAQRFYGDASPRRFAIIIGQIAVRGRH